MAKAKPAALKEFSEILLPKRTDGIEVKKWDGSYYSEN
jgi:hypothetical protein